MRRQGIALGIALGLLTAVPAQAAHVGTSHRCDPDGRHCFGQVRFEAAAGEANAVTVSSGARRPIRLTDTGAPLTAGELCEQVDAHTVDCSQPAEAYQVVMLLGDGDDTLNAPRQPIVARGGPGDDQLLSGGGLDGGPGRDVLDARAAVFGQADYRERTVAVHVDLAAGTMTAADGDTDTLLGLQWATGGSGDDVLEGDGGPNRLTGGRGDDTLRGRAGRDPLVGESGDDRIDGGDGSDQIEGGSGRNTVNGGAGSDTIYPGSGRRGTNQFVRCGAGERDSVSAGPTDVVEAETCEHVIVGEQNWAFQPHLPLRSLRDPVGAMADGLSFHGAIGCFRVPCPRARLTVGHTVVAARTLEPRRTLYRHPDVRLTHAGRALLERRRILRVRVMLASDSVLTGGSFLMDLRAPSRR
jgi:Ca2+-binding RTX toxin-like protein